MDISYNVTSVQINNNDQNDIFITDENAMFEPDIVTYWPYKLQRYIFIYASPIIIIGGTVGNLLSLLIMQSAAFRSSPSSLILSILALADTGSLNTGLWRHWIGMYTEEEIMVRTQSEAGCRIHFYFTYLFVHLSSWYLILLTIERVVCILIPLKCKEICSRKHMVISIAVVTVTLMLVNSHLLFTTTILIEEEKVEYKNETYEYIHINCDFIKESPFFYLGGWYWIDATLDSFVPLLVIFTGNITIITKLKLNRRKPMSELGSANNEIKKTKVITVMLLFISNAFLLLKLPACIYFLGIGTGTWESKTNLEEAQNLLAYAVVNLLAYTNHAINFVLYCLSGSKFRKALVDVLCFCRRPPTPA